MTQLAEDKNITHHMSGEDFKARSYRSTLARNKVAAHNYAVTKLMGQFLSM